MLFLCCLPFSLKFTFTPNIYTFGCKFFDLGKSKGFLNLHLLETQGTAGVNGLITTALADYSTTAQVNGLIATAVGGIEVSNYYERAETYSQAEVNSVVSGAIDSLNITQQQLQRGRLLHKNPERLEILPEQCQPRQRSVHPGPRQRFHPEANKRNPAQGTSGVELPVLRNHNRAPL